MTANVAGLPQELLPTAVQSNSTVTVLVTPELALSLLGKNRKNQRPLAARRVREMARAMKTGGWISNGDVIRIDKNGSLIDGQHRLSAVVLANIPVELEIRYGFGSCGLAHDRQGSKAIGESGATQ